jgi:hypothetical protein
MSLYSAQVFFPFGFSEEKEVIMTSKRNPHPVYDVCVRDIPET